MLGKYTNKLHRAIKERSYFLVTCMGKQPCKEEPEKTGLTGIDGECLLKYVKRGKVSIRFFQ